MKRKQITEKDIIIHIERTERTERVEEESKGQKENISP